MNKCSLSKGEIKNVDQISLFFHSLGKKQWKESLLSSSITVYNYFDNGSSWEIVYGKFHRHVFVKTHSLTPHSKPPNLVERDRHRCQHPPIYSQRYKCAFRDSREYESVCVWSKPLRNRPTSNTLQLLGNTVAATTITVKLKLGCRS